VAHNGSIIPVPGRDIMVQSWYQGGISVVDFTDSGNPIEIAYFDRGPIDEEELVVGGYWSSYWYDGKIFATEIVRGIDVFSLMPSEYLSDNEIGAALMADQGQVFNPQQQFRATWPADPIVARAYIDQLERSGDLSPSAIENLDAVLNRAESHLEAGTKDRRFSAALALLADELDANGGDAIATKRIAGLKGTLDDLAASLR
jgi:hypothetical protein